MKKRSSADTLYRAFLYMVLITLAVVIFVPVGWVFLASIKQNSEFYGDPWALPASFYYQNFVDAWNAARMGRNTPPPGLGGAAQPITGITDSMEGDNKIFYSIFDNGASAVMGGFATYESVAGLGSVREVFFDPMNDLVNGTLTTDEWVANIKTASDQMRANLIQG